MKYIYTVTNTVKRHLYIEADTDEKAEEIAKQWADDNDGTLDEFQTFEIVDAEMILESKGEDIDFSDYTDIDITNYLGD